VRFQSVFTCLFTPLQAVVIDHINPLAMVHNWVLIPWVTLCLLPLCLLILGALLLDELLLWNLSPVVFLLSLLLKLLQMGIDLALSYLSWWPEAVWVHGLSAWFWWGMFLVKLLVLNIPMRAYRRILLAVALVAGGIWYGDQEQRQHPPTLVVFSVGQGSMSLYHDATHAFVFDTGVGFSERFNSFHLVLQPYLQAKRITQLDAVFISHFDSDHSGGLQYLQQAFPQTPVYAPGQGCYRGQTWQFGAEYDADKDKAKLAISAWWPNAPPAGGQHSTQDSRQHSRQLRSKNNGSCVLLLEFGRNRILFPGDIEAPAERVLIASQPPLQDIDVLIAPHHGSDTSSTKAFVEYVRPSHVIFSTGYLNRWQLPAKQVQCRYVQVSHSRLYNTAQNGALMLQWQAPGQLRIQRYKQDVAQRWYTAGSYDKTTFCQD
jgi:competence protein ComEC